MAMKIREVVVTGQRKVELQERELDEKLERGELLIQTERTFISTKTKLANYMARDKGVFRPGNWCAYPWRSGYGNVGVVKEVGPGVTRAKVGQRVLSYGNHASFVKYSDDRLLIQVPEGMDSVTAAASRMAGVAFTSLVLAEIKGAPWVVVFGLGAVGNLAAQGFAGRGCRVIGVDPVAERRALANRCGIANTVGGTPKEVNSKVRELTGGAMGGIVVEAVGHAPVCMEALDATGYFGQLFILGSPRVSTDGDLNLAFGPIHYKYITVRGALEWCIPMYPEPGVPISQYEKQQMIFDWIGRGILNTGALVSHRLPPEKISEAYEGLETKKNEYTGVALVWS